MSVNQSYHDQHDYRHPWLIVLHPKPVVVSVLQCPSVIQVHNVHSPLGTLPPFWPHCVQSDQFLDTHSVIYSCNTHSPVAPPHVINHIVPRVQNFVFYNVHRISFGDIICHLHIAMQITRFNNDFRTWDICVSAHERAYITFSYVWGWNSFLMYLKAEISPNTWQNESKVWRRELIFKCK